MIHTVKSFLQVVEYTTPDTLLFTATRNPFIILYDAISVEMLDLKPYCSSTSMSFLHICVNSLIYIGFSKTLEKEVNKDMGRNLMWYVYLNF